MPYQSIAQMRLMHAKHPGIAARWDKEYGPMRFRQKAADEREPHKGRAKKRDPRRRISEMYDRKE